MDTLAQAQIELNKKYGGRLVAIAWSIEIRPDKPKVIVNGHQRNDFKYR